MIGLIVNLAIFSLPNVTSGKKESMHSTFEDMVSKHYERSRWYREISEEYIGAIDDHIFHSQPSSFFVLDDRIPRIIRELITEAEGCLKMNFLTGASACMRKAIYEFIVKEKAEGDNYQSKIKDLKKKHPSVDPTYFDVLSHIQDMTSEKIHEQSWDKWDSKYVKLIIEALKSVLYEIYVLPIQKAERVSSIERLRELISSDKKQVKTAKDVANEGKNN